MLCSRSVTTAAAMVEADRKAVERFYSEVYSRGHSQSIFFKSPSATLLNKTEAEEQENESPAKEAKAFVTVKKPVNMVELYRKWKTIQPMHLEAKVTYAHHSLPCKYRKLLNAPVSRDKRNVSLPSP